MQVNESTSLFEKFITYEKNLSANTVRAYKNDLAILKYFFEKEGVACTKEINYQLFKKFLK